MSSPGTVNESVALGVNPPAAPQSNPIQLLGSLAETQNALNTAKLFRESFAAKQKAGEIISAAPDMDSAIAQMKADPLIPGFLPEIINSYQGLQALTAQTAGARQANTTNALHEVLQAVPQAATDPASFDKAIQTRLGAIPKDTRDAIAPSISSLRDSLYNNLPKDPKEAQLALNKRFNAIMLGSGFTPDIVSGLSAKAESVQTPQGVVPVVRAPGILGGAVTQVPGYIPNAIAPQMVGTPSGAMIPYNPNSGGGSASAAAGGNSLIPSTGAAAGTPAAAGARAAASTPGAPKGLGGIPIMSQAEAEQASAMMKDFSTGGVREYSAAQQSLGYLKQMDNDFDTLAKGGGALTPGGGAQWRLQLAKSANTLSQALGGKPIIDPSKVASGEAANKITNTLGFNLVNQFLGGQKEAFGTIEKGIQSVPGIENSYLGGKLLVESLRQTAQRAIDQRQFQQAWAQQRGGNLEGSIEAFNTQYPPERYADAALGKFGLTEKGFTTPQAVKAAVGQGYLSKDQGVKILTSQFGPGKQ